MQLNQATTSIIIKEPGMQRTPTKQKETTQNIIVIKEKSANIQVN